MLSDMVIKCGGSGGMSDGIGADICVTVIGRCELSVCDTREGLYLWNQQK